MTRTTVTAADDEPDEGSRAAILHTFRRMVSALDVRGQRELERAMLLTLYVRETPTEARIAELGFLAEQLAATPRLPGCQVSYNERQEYDRLRPDDAPLSARLVERYGCWRAACWHAYGLLPDGRWLGPSRPWRTYGSGARRGEPYTRHEVLSAIRHCRRDLGRRPSSSDFFRWVRAKRRAARKQGRALRLAGHGALYRHFPVGEGGWNAALRASEREQ